MVRTHKDLIRNGKRTSGYAIRVGRQVPRNSANLAYVHSDPVSPDNNLVLEDLTSSIRENGIDNYVQRDYIVYPDDKYILETESGQSVFPTDTVYVTDEFTVKRNRQDEPTPVFYLAAVSGLFDVRNSVVLPYVGGYTTETEEDAVTFENIPPDQRNELLYFGNSIRIEGNGVALTSDERFKIKLVRSKDYFYRIYIYTNFQSKPDTTYKVVYPRYNKKTNDSTLKYEVLNAYPFFESVTNKQFEEIVKDIEGNPDIRDHRQIYTTVKNDGGYQILATSDVMVADYNTRTPQMFKHRVEAKLKTKLSEINKGYINIGFVHAQNAVGVENLKSIGKMIYEHELIPNYLEVKNALSEQGGLIKRNIEYWHVDLSTPQELIKNLDIVVITGYGKIDLTLYREKLIQFMQKGGVVWVDNAGNNEQVLDFTVDNINTFITDISFSSKEVIKGDKKIVVSESPYLNRLYQVSEADKIGYTGICPRIVFGNNERMSNWSVIVSCNNSLSIIKKDIEKGVLIVSNCGVFRDIYHNGESSTHLLINTLIHHTEEQWFVTPWRNDFVYNRENLFAQEYKDESGDIYIDDRNDYNPSQIVAKKILHSNVAEYTKDYVKSWFFHSNVEGTYYHKIDSDRSIPITNGGFESSYLDVGIVIPGWEPVRLAGDDCTFTHESEVTIRGKRHVSLRSKNSSGAHAYWESDVVYLPKDTYYASAWVKYSEVQGLNTEGATIGAYNKLGEMIASTKPLKGSSDWIEVFFEFSLEENQEVTFRIGFGNGNCTGLFCADDFRLETAGVVRGTPVNNGLQQLVAYSIKPNATTIDIQSEGFVNSNITRVQPEVPYTYTIRSFIYKLIEIKEGINVYEKMYGPQVSYSGRIKKGDGLVSLGYLHALTPASPGGKDWSDNNKIYYEISLGDPNEVSNNLVSLQLFDKRTGNEWYGSNSLIIGYRDMYSGVDKPTFVLHAETKYETIRATKRHFGIHMADNNRISCELPKTQDTKENWYIRFRNGQFTKEELGYKEWSELYRIGNGDLISKVQDRTTKRETYSIKEYKEQVFEPSEGIMTVENEALYVNPKTIRVPHSNLYIREGSVEMEELIPDGVVYSYNKMKHGYDAFEAFNIGDNVGRITTKDGTATISDKFAYHGETSMEVANGANLIEVWLDTASGQTKRERINVDAGQDYIYSFYVYNPSNLAIEVDGIVEFENGDLFGTPKTSITKENGWQRIEVYFIAPSGGNAISVGVRVYGSGPVFFDCFQVEDAQ